MVLYFWKVKCSTELVNWGNIPDSSFPIPDLLPHLPPWVRWSMPAVRAHQLCSGQEGSPLLQVACSSRALSKGERAPSRVAQNWQARARQQQPVPGIPGNPSALCLTGFVPGFNPVFILEHAGWPKSWVELKSLMSQPGGACRAARR